jgi:hypothetical protein
MRYHFSAVAAGILAAALLLATHPKDVPGLADWASRPALSICPDCNSNWVRDEVAPLPVR